MKTWVTINLIVMFATGHALSQSKEEYKRTSMGIVLSPGVSYRWLSYSHPDSWIEDIRNEREESIYALTAGLSLNYDLRANMVLESGVLYAVKGYQTNSIELQWATPDQKFPVSSKARFNLKFLELPLRFKYFVLKGDRFRSFVVVGPSVNFFVQKRINVISEFPDGDKAKNHSEVNTGYARFSLAATIGIGVEYALSRRLLIMAEPVYTQFVTSVIVGDEAKEYPYSVGMNMGLLYRFRRKNADPAL